MTKTVMITGATAGFGAAAVRRFAIAGWRVVATGRRADRLQKLIDEFGKEKVFTLSFDMRKPDAIETALATLPEPFRKIDLLINNAGLALGTAPAQKASLEQWNQMIETNVTGLVTITHRLLPTLIAQKGAVISCSGLNPSTAHERQPHGVDAGQPIFRTVSGRSRCSGLRLIAQAFLPILRQVPVY